MRIEVFLTLLIFWGNILLLQCQSKDILARSAMLNAEASYENGNYRECIDFLKEAEVNLGKTNSRIQYVKVKSLLALGTQDGYNKDFLLRADQELKLFFKVTPENSYVPEKYDEMVLELTRLKRMIAEADREVEIENQVFTSAKNTNTIDAYKEYIDRYPKGRFVLEAEERIKGLIRQKDLNAKIQDCTNIINNLPKKRRNEDYNREVQAYIERGNAKYTLKDYQGSIQDYTSAIKLDPNNAVTYNNRGYSRYILTDYQGALQDYTKAIEFKHPNNGLVYCNRGNTKYALKDYQGAIQDYSKATELDPKKELYFYRRGSAKSRLKDYQGAIQDYTRAIELNPKADNAYLNRGNAKSGLNDYEGAIQDYTKTIELAPQSTGAYFSRGYTKARLKDHQGAIQDYTRAIELNPEYLSAYYYRGKIYHLTLKNIQTAKPDFEKVVRLNADSSLTAYSHFFLGNKEKAYRILNDLIKVAGNNTEKLKSANYNLACLYSIEGNKAEAINALNKSLMNGYDNFSRIEEDEDFDNIKNSPEFKQLINNYKNKSNSETISDTNQTLNNNNSQQPQNSVLNSNKPDSNNPVKDTGSEVNKSDKNIQITSAVSNSGINFPSDLDYGSVSDVDGNTYKTIQIGTQTWMAENLKTTRLNDGSEIPNVTESENWDTLSTFAFCWYNNDIAKKAEYGALYTWQTIGTGKICPFDWHVPTDAELATLTTYLGGLSIAGGKIKENGTTHWRSPNKGATNETGFTALPGGVRRGDGVYGGIGTSGYWWSSTDYSKTGARYWGINCFGTGIEIKGNGKETGYSVRCVKD